MKRLPCVTIALFAILFNSCTDAPVPTSIISENIDSLIAVVKKDSGYRIKNVSYSKKDSVFIITVKDKDGSAEYFNSVYHVGDFKGVEEIRVCDIHNKELSSESKKGQRLAIAFKEKYCQWNKCEPLEEKIKEGMNDPDSFEADRLWVEWGGDSSLIVTETFRGKNAFGGKVLNKAQASIDMNGAVSSFKIVD